MLRRILAFTTRQRRPLLFFVSPRPAIYCSSSSASSSLGLFVRRFLCSSTSTSTSNNSNNATSPATAATVQQPPQQKPLIELENVILCYPGSSSSSSSRKQSQEGGLNLAIYPAGTGGGHALLGRNGSGKSLIANTLANAGKTVTSSSSNNEYLQSGNLHIDSSTFTWHSSTIAQVSFESHQALLQQGGGTTTVSKAISRGTGKLNKAAQFLIVRFGLYPFLHRHVETLSTGEIRKVLLVRALAERPRLLILDNAFDGLDVSSREMLKDIVSKTILGFRTDILVQAVSAKATAHTKVLLLTHRSEEIVTEIETISQWKTTDGGGGGELETFSRQDKSGQEMLMSALGNNMPILQDDDSMTFEPWNDPTLPTSNEIADIWNLGRQQQHQNEAPSDADADVVAHYANDDDDDDNDILVQATNLTVRRGDVTLIDNLNWTVQSGERWLVAGGNGAGKSSLSRLLAHETNMADFWNPNSSLLVNIPCIEPPDSSNQQRQRRRSNVGWVSTELHMSMARSKQTVQQVLEHNGQTPSDVAIQFAKYLQLVHDNDDVDTFLHRPFCELSQGQQKLTLIAAAIASRPKLLILDEPQTGLDMIHRNRVLGLVERICQAVTTNKKKNNTMALIYISHHLEELIPSVDKILHLQHGKAIYNSSRIDYDPDAL